MQFIVLLILRFTEMIGLSSVCLITLSQIYIFGCDSFIHCVGNSNFIKLQTRTHTQTCIFNRWPQVPHQGPNPNRRWMNHIFSKGTSIAWIGPILGVSIVSPYFDRSCFLHFIHLSDRENNKKKKITRDYISDRFCRITDRTRLYIDDYFFVIIEYSFQYMNYQLIGRLLLFGQYLSHCPKFFRFIDLYIYK